MLCVTTMAKDGGHATCGVKRGTVFECDGAVKRVPWAALELPQPKRPRLSPGYRNCDPSPPPASPPRGCRSDTRARGAAANGARDGQAGQRADGRADEEQRQGQATVEADATKKTWDCMMSLFTRC